MENYTNSTSELELRSLEIFERVLPVICIMAILGTFGVVGNIVAIIFYTRKCKRNTTVILISFLAVMDTFVCILIAFQLVEMAVNVSNYQRALCKMVHAIGIGCVGSSVLSLMLIAIDRHRKICLPFKKQLTQKVVKYAIIGSLIFFFCLGIRNLFTFDTIRVELKGDSGEIFYGSYCTASDNPKYKKISSIFNSIDLLIVVTVWITIIVCYSLVAIRVVKLRKTRKHNDEQNAKKHESGTTNTNKKLQVPRLQNLAETDDYTTDLSCSDTKETDFESAGTNDKVKLKSAKQTIAPTQLAKLDKDTFKPQVPVTKEPMSMSETIETDDETTEQQQPQLKRRSKRYSKRRPKKSSGISSRELRLTFMMLTVSIVFILCFLPYFAIRIVARIVLKTGEEFELAPLKQMALRLPYLNSVFNPFIYLLFNREFRAFVWTPIRKLQRVTMHW